MAPLERTAFIYAAREAEGYVVDWETGELSKPESSPLHPGAQGV